MGKIVTHLCPLSLAPCQRLGRRGVALGEVRHLATSVFQAKFR